MSTQTTTISRKQALIYGLFIGIVVIALCTIENKCFAGHFIQYYLVKFLGYVVFLILLGVCATRIKRSGDGFLEFREAFGVIFIMILVAEVLYYIYLIIYLKYIDHDFLLRMKTGVLAFMEKNNTPEDKIATMTKKIDEEIAESKVFNFGNNIWNFVQLLLIDSVFGLIVAVIVKRKRPLIDE